MSDSEDLLDIKHAAGFLGVSQTSLRRWTNSGQLACLRVGGKRERRFRRADLVAFMETQPVADAPSRSPGGRQHTTIAGIPVTFGTHLCALYGNDAGRTKLAVAFLSDGLHSGSVCFLNASAEARGQILGQLERRRGSLQPEVDAGRLVLCRYCDTPREQYDYWETNFLSATNAGATSLRVVGDMTSCLDAGMTLDRLMEYEAGYDRRLAKRFPVVTLCLYDVRRFESLEVVKALEAHTDMFRYPAERLLA
ncbi:MAG TPA: MEDS domain-containing protein [Gemmatimonadales bacterium]|nr:MEDS domain-containing protein [Gemmatimonadales bacterium]